MRHVVLTVCLLSAAFAPAAAHAQTPVVPPATPAVAAPVETQLSLKVERVGGSRATTLAGSSVRVRGTVGVFVPNQVVVVRHYLAGRKRGARRMTLRPGPNGSGVFVLSVKPASIGPLSIRAFHDPTPELGGLAARARTVDVIPRRVVPKSGRRSVRALQRRLAGLGYVVGERGSFDARTARAVLAFRKVTNMARTVALLDERRGAALAAGELHGRLTAVDFDAEDRRPGLRAELLDDDLGARQALAARRVGVDAARGLLRQRRTRRLAVAILERAVEVLHGLADGGRVVGVAGVATAGRREGDDHRRDRGTRRTTPATLPG